jgi:phage-related protein
VVTLITTVVEMLPELIPMLLDAAIMLFLAIVAAMPVILPKLTTAIIDLIIKVVMLLPTLIPALISAAINLFTAIVNAVPQVAAGLVAAVSELMDEGKNVIPEFISKFETAGKDLIDGVIKGITGSIGKLKDAVTEAARKALKAATDFLGIKSPSTVFAFVGKMIDEGWAGGVSKNAKRVVTAVADTAKAMLDAARKTDVGRALSVSPGFVAPAYTVAGGGPFRARYAASGATAGGSGGDSVTVQYFTPVASYADTVRGVLDAKRAAARW